MSWGVIISHRAMRCITYYSSKENDALRVPNVLWGVLRPLQMQELKLYEIKLNCKSIFSKETGKFPIETKYNYFIISNSLLSVSLASKDLLVKIAKLNYMNDELNKIVNRGS
jgi:hypothetical protein